jgi:hypothetical protein
MYPRYPHDTMTMTTTLICKRNIKIKLHSYSVKFIAVVKQVFVNLNRLCRNMYVRCVIGRTEQNTKVHFEVVRGGRTALMLLRFGHISLIVT